MTENHHPVIDQEFFWKVESSGPNRFFFYWFAFRKVIGKGGGIIKTIRQESGARIDAEDWRAELSIVQRPNLCVLIFGIDIVIFCTALIFCIILFWKIVIFCPWFFLTIF